MKGKPEMSHPRDSVISGTASGAGTSPVTGANAQGEGVRPTRQQPEGEPRRTANLAAARHGTRTADAQASAAEPVSATEAPPTGIAGLEASLRPWTPAEQACHRADLEAALDGPGLGDAAWRALAAQVLGHAPTPRVDRPRAPRSDQAKARRKRGATVCTACRARRHGPDCAIATHADGAFLRCGCGCRAVLGLTAFLDATAPEVADFEQEVA